MALQIAERIETARLSLQRLRYVDAEEIFYVYASKPEATKFMAWPTHQSINDTRNFLNYAVYGWARGADYSFAIRLKDSNRMIGSCGLVNEEGKIQFGYVLSPLHWGRGYATEATQVLLSQLKNHTGIFRVSTFVDAENTASIKVLKKCGFSRRSFLEEMVSFSKTKIMSPKTACCSDY